MAVTAFSSIRNKTIFKNGTQVFKDLDASLENFLLNTYGDLKIDYPKVYKMDNQSKAGFLAAEVLLQDGLLRGLDPSDVALVLANANASLDTDRRHAASAEIAASPAVFVYTLANIVAGEICIRHKIKGENAFFVSPQFDAGLMVNYVEMVPAQAIIAGWVDVVGEQHDVFLYLYQRNVPSGEPHSPDVINELYSRALWNS
jgi:hypothetical protein